MPTEKPRFSLSIPQELLNRIDQYRFDNHIKNQTKAVVTLLEIGLTSLGITPPAPLEPSLSASDTHLLEAYHNADATAQSFALEMLENHPAQKKANRA